MKLTLTEAYEQATKGPLEFSTPSATHISTPEYPTILDVPWANGMPEKEWRANKAVLVHAFNHFLKVVETLDKIIKSAEEMYAFHGHLPFEGANEAREILAEASTVEVPE